MLRDLKALLIEARQKVPPMLTTLDSLSDDLIQLGGKRSRVALKVYESDNKCVFHKIKFVFGFQ